MSITTKAPDDSNVVYNAIRTEGPRTSYIGANHSDITKDMLVVTSNNPKRVGDSYGNRRTSFNLVRSSAVGTPSGSEEVKDAKVELLISVPVGTSDALLDEMLTAVKSLTLANIKAAAVVGQTQL